MSAWARPGVKVVCVDACAPDYDWRDWHSSWLVEGKTYTIRSVLDHPFIPGNLGILVDEIDGNYNDYLGLEQGFKLARFRPLITKTQSEDVALIKSLLVGDEVSA